MKGLWVLRGPLLVGLGLAAAVVGSLAGGCTTPNRAGQHGAQSASSSVWFAPTGPVPSGASAPGQASAGQPALDYKTGVTVKLQRVFSGGETLSFGLPLPPGAVARWQDVKVTAGGAELPARIRPLLVRRDGRGAEQGVASIEIELPASALPAGELALAVSWTGATAPAAAATASFAAASVKSPETVRVADRYIGRGGVDYVLVEENVRSVPLFDAVEPRVLATFPPGYLAATGLLNPHLRAGSSVSPRLGGLQFLVDSVLPFARSTVGEVDYPLHPKAVEPLATMYEAWLYDRCATLLMFHAFTNDPQLLRHANRTCAFFTRTIRLDGDGRGLSSVKPDGDSKYSRLKGIYAYYALTGDEAALAAGQAIADHWLNDPVFVLPYAAGHIRGPDRLWTERHLSASLEGLYYGYLLTGERKYYARFLELFATAYRHITTTDQAELNAITSLGTAQFPAFPPQNCFVHSGVQHTDGGEKDPWCSAWMSALLVDVLSRYAVEMGDARASEILLRLGRFVRDTATTYFDESPLKDAFLRPSSCFRSPGAQSERVLIPSYGAGIDASGKTVLNPEGSDFEHCPDVAALSAAALAALATHGADTRPTAPFRTRFADEQASLLALHSELAFCAKWTLSQYVRVRRDPREWKSRELQEGYANGDRQAQEAWLTERKIGFPTHPTSPNRKVSWWYNAALLQFGLLEAAGVELSTLSAGKIQPAGCP